MPDLVQGREDLRRDERLMQLLRTANAALRSSDTSAGRRLRSRTFGVVPLGPRAGLIEWVENTHSLFDIYQNWQRHTAGGAAQPVACTCCPSLRLCKSFYHTAYHVCTARRSIVRVPHSCKFPAYLLL